MNYSLVLKKIFNSVPKVSGKLKPEESLSVEFASLVREAQLLNATKKRFVWTHVANEFAGKKRPVFGAILKAMGKTSGWPDYVFMWDNGCGAIELKVGKNSQQQNQKDVQSWFDHSGVPYRVAYSMEQAMDIMDEWGLI